MRGKSVAAAVAGLLVFLIVAYLVLAVSEPVEAPPSSPTPHDFQHGLWEYRGWDVVVQMALVFSGVLGVLALLRREVSQ